MSAEGRFGALAAAYGAFRPPWPEEVFACILARTPAPRRRALDLGAGTGLVARRLADEFEHVVALEPDARMLALLAPHPRIERVEARAEDAAFPPASFELVTAGNAFHWMEGPAVLARVRHCLVPGGVVALFRYDPPHASEGALEEVLAREYGVAWRAHVHPRLYDRDYARRSLAESDFGARMETHRLANDLTLALPELLGFLRSTSYGGNHARTLADPEGYWRDLETRIRAAAGPGPFVLDFHVELALATKP